MNRPAVFLDRDGTLIEDPGYLDEPNQVRLLPGAAEAIKRFAQAGYRIVLVTNQSGVARGYFDEQTVSKIHARVEELLNHEGAALDGIYYCPFLNGPEATVDAYRKDSELRKPNPGMLLQAAKDLRIDLTRSWMIGDALTDVEAGRRAGCRTVLLRNGDAPSPSAPASANAVAPTITAAADIVLRGPAQAPVGAPPDQGNANTDRVVAVLTDIHQLLERAQRRDRQQDFSVLRLAGALLQMFAIAAAAWGAAALLQEHAPSATARLLLACLLQVASLHAFTLDRFR